MFPQTASLSLKLPLKCCNTSVSFFTLGGIIWSTGAKSTENGIFQWKATIFVIISFLISTKATLNNNAKEWVIHLMSTLTGQDASFLTSTLTSGSAEELQGSATRAFQDSPTARPRLAFGPPASKSPPITISVPGQGHWHKSITLISLDGIGILIAPVAKWVRCSTIGKLAQALRNFACAERREGIYCSSFAHLCLHPLMLMIVMACF